MSQYLKKLENIYLEYPRCEFCGFPWDGHSHLYFGGGSGGDSWVYGDCNTENIKKFILYKKEGK